MKVGNTLLSSVESNKETSIFKVSFRVLRHFTHKASVRSVNAEANAHSADWLMSVFVNELAPPHARSQQGQCVRQCRRIMKDTLVNRSTETCCYLQ